MIQLKTDGATPVVNENLDLTAREFYSAIMIQKKHRDQRYNTPSGGSDNNNYNAPNPTNRLDNPNTPANAAAPTRTPNASGNSVTSSKYS